jgi:hypothetical protein
MSLVSEPEDAPNPKLPLGNTISLSYSTYFQNFMDVLRISWLWLVVVAPLAGLASWLQMSWLAEVAANMKPGMPPQMPARPFEAILLPNVAGLVVVLAGVSIAVAWHRRLILGEHPGLSGSNVATRSLWRYVVIGLAIILIVALPALAIIVPMIFLLSGLATTGVLALPGPWSILLILVFLLVYVTGFGAMLRLSILLPARAVGDVGLTFKETWNRTRGNTWRMFWGIVACTLPLFAAQVVLALVGFPAPGPGMFANEAFASRMAVINAIFSVFYLLILPIGIGFLSHSYRHFFKPVPMSTHAGV